MTHPLDHVIPVVYEGREEDCGGFGKPQQVPDMTVVDSLDRPRGETTQAYDLL